LTEVEIAKICPHYLKSKIEQLKSAGLSESEIELLYPGHQGNSNENESKNNVKAESKNYENVNSSKYNLVRTEYDKKVNLKIEEKRYNSGSDGYGKLRLDLRFSSDDIVEGTAEGAFDAATGTWTKISLYIDGNKVKSEKVIPTKNFNHYIDLPSGVHTVEIRSRRIALLILPDGQEIYSKQIYIGNNKELKMSLRGDKISSKN
jgi:hypothetical protein